VRVFADTNVLASAFGTHGLCAELLETIIEQHELVCSDPVLKELRGVLFRKFRLPATRCAEVEAFLRTFEILPVPQRLAELSGLTKSDLTILTSALEGRCEIFVSGDRQLLTRVRDHPQIRALDPSGCWMLLRKQLQRKI